MGLLILITFNLIFAGTPTFTKITAEYFEPATLVWIRHSMAFLAVTLIVVFRWRRWKPISKHALVRIALATLLAYTIPSLLQAEAVMRSTASAGAIMVAMEPIMMIIFAVIVLHERLRVPMMMALCAAIAGFVVLSTGHGEMQLKGNLLYLLAVSCEASFPVMLRPLLKTYPASQVLWWCLFFASAFLLPFQPFTMDTAIFAVPAMVWQSLLYLSLGCSGIAVYLWLVSLTRLQVSTVAISWFLQPVMGSILAVILLSESIGSTTVIGGGMILMAVLIVSKHEEQQQTSTTSTISHQPLDALWRCTHRRHAIDYTKNPNMQVQHLHWLPGTNGRIRWRHPPAQILPFLRKHHAYTRRQRMRRSAA